MAMTTEARDKCYVIEDAPNYFTVMKETKTHTILDHA